MNGSAILSDIKTAALEAVGASAPCEIKFGTVTSVKPLLVRLEQKITLSSEALILPRRFTVHKVKITAGNVADFYYLSDDVSENVSENSGSEPVEPPHKHAVGDMEITVHGGLKAGDKLILLRQQGGQKFLIFDVSAD